MKETRQISKEIRKFAEQLATRSQGTGEFQKKEQSAQKRLEHRKKLEKFRGRRKRLERD